jgi:hypothetical protein
LLYSDFHREVMSMAVVPPLYVTCRGCSHVHLLIEFRDAWRPAGSAALARWVGTTPDEAFAALVQEQPPFYANSGFAHMLRLHLWRTENRRMAEGVPIANAQRREQLQQTLTLECVARSHMPVYQYLLAEMERQRGDFEPAAQRLRNLVEDANTDSLLATHSRQNLEWCLEGRTLQQKFPAPPTVQRAPAAHGGRPRVYKFVVFVSNSAIYETLNAWVNFPGSILNVGDLKYLPIVASMSDPGRGVILLESDLDKMWPGESGMTLFIESLSKNERTSPWLLLGSQGQTRARVAALRGVGFHVTWMDPSQLDRRRFEEWASHGLRRAEHQWRRVQKFA